MSVPYPEGRMRVAVVVGTDVHIFSKLQTPIISKHVRVSHNRKTGRTSYTKYFTTKSRRGDFERRRLLRITHCTTRAAALSMAAEYMNKQRNWLNTNPEKDQS